MHVTSDSHIACADLLDRCLTPNCCLPRFQSPLLPGDVALSRADRQLPDRKFAKKEKKKEKKGVERSKKRKKEDRIINTCTVLCSPPTPLLFYMFCPLDYLQLFPCMDKIATVRERDVIKTHNLCVFNHQAKKKSLGIFVSLSFLICIRSSPDYFRFSASSSSNFQCNCSYQILTQSLSLFFLFFSFFRLAFFALTSLVDTEVIYNVDARL